MNPNLRIVTVENEDDTSRDTLRTLIQQRDAALVVREKSRDAADRANAFIARLQAGLRDFAGVDARIADERAQQFKVALAEGETAPSLDMSPELVALSARRMNLENQLAAGQQAQQQLAQELRDAQQILDNLQAQVLTAAKKVVANHADTMAAQLADMEQRAGAARRRLLGASAMRTQDKGPFPLQPQTIALLRDSPSNSIFTRNTGDDVRFWDAWRERLMTDADALPDEV